MYFWCSFSMRGMTLAHGPHQLAQKSSTMTFPLYSDSECDTPSASLSVQSGAGSPTASNPALPLSSSPTPPREGQTAVRRQQTAITTPATFFLIIPLALETVCPPGHDGVVGEGRVAGPPDQYVGDAPASVAAHGYRHAQRPHVAPAADVVDARLD